MAKLISWNDLPQSIKDFDANISNNLDSCESKANELSVMVNDILVLLKDADTTLKEDFKEDPQCIDSEKKLYLIYSGFNVVKTSIDNDLISGIIAMGKEVKATINDIRKKIEEGASWKEASEEEDSQGNKVLKENDQAKIDAANKYINKMADCAVEEINAIKNAQASVKLGISLENLTAGELGKYIKFSPSFTKTDFITNYDSINIDYTRVVEPDNTVIKPDDTDSDGLITKFWKYLKSVVGEAKEDVVDFFEDVKDNTAEENISSFGDWLSDLAIFSTFPGLSGIIQAYNATVDDPSKMIDLPGKIKKDAKQVIQTVEDSDLFKNVQNFWGAFRADPGKAISDVVETVDEKIDDLKETPVGKVVVDAYDNAVDNVVQNAETMIENSSNPLETLRFFYNPISFVQDGLFGLNTSLFPDFSFITSLFNKE